MELFKERLKEAGAFILFLIVVLGVPAALLYILKSIWEPLPNIIVGIIFLLLIIIWLVSVLYKILKGIYWLFIEPFILVNKNKKSRRG